MLKPLVLANKQFRSQLIQGPLAGVSSAPFRVLCQQYSDPAYCCTEMLSAKTLIHQSGEARRRLVLKDSREGALCFQLSAADPKELAEATKIVADLGADLVDLNCGCPVKKIRKKGAGSRLLSEPSKLYQLIKAMKDNSPVPVTVKIRVDGQADQYNAEIAKVVAEAGADALIVHGRHWTEHYETACRLDAIAYFVSCLKIPVIGNGDVACLASYKRMLATGCAAVMIGRAGVGQPWLIKQLNAEYQGQHFSGPTEAEKGALFIQHAEGLVDLLGSEKFAILQARKFAKYYSRSLNSRPLFCEQVNLAEDLKSLRSLVAAFFGSD